MIKDYIAPDGSGRLHLNDRAVLDGQETVSNQNGILFLAYLARSNPNYTWGLVVSEHANIVSLGKGRFIRRKGDPLRQSHDNVLAWAWFSTHLNARYARDIYDFAKWRFFIYDPHHRFSLDYRCWLQPSHICILSLAAGEKPSWLSCLWFSFSCLVADHSSNYYLKSMLRSDIVRAKSASLSKYKKKLVFWALELMEKRREGMARWYYEYYNDKKHPAVLAAVEREI